VRCGDGVLAHARVLMCAAAFLALACQSPPAPQPTQGDVRSPHRDADGFFNPWHRYEPAGLWTYVRWQLFSRNAYDKSAAPSIPVVQNDGAYLAGVETSASITWVGHATFAVHDRDDVFLTDPHFGKRAFLPARTTQPGLPIASIPRDAFAVISHNHYDHLDEWTIESLPESVGYYVPVGLGEWFRKRGRTDVTELDWWESAARGRFTITCLPSQHWSLRLGQPANSTLWCSWLVDSQDYRYYFAGDTGYFPGFAELGRAWDEIDVAMLPIGSYAPRWVMAYQHMDPAEAYRAFQDLGARYMLPMHWGAFDITDEPLDRPPVDLARAIAEARGDPERVRVMAIGERWKVPAREDAETAGEVRGRETERKER
jgi:L-ascorbate metabolism protein UlaG (beta-lactamase superfamily)